MQTSRRSFFSRYAAAGAAAFTIVKPQLVRGWAAEKMKIGLIGCGGRGRAAVVDNFLGDPATELVAMGDIFEDKLEGSLKFLRENKQLAEMQDRIKVAPDKRFVGFDAYKKVLASDAEIIFLCTPPGWRPLHFEAAINAKKHVFCEKPFGTDATGIRRFMEAVRKSEQMKLTVVSGAQRRSDPAYIEAVDKIKNGSIGDVVAMYAYWVGTPVIQQKARDPKWGDLEWQHRNWYSNLWICGDQIVEQHLHNIDVCNWIMGGHPVKVVASGGAVWRPREELYGSIYDHVAADFEYANGVRMSSYCRQYPGRLYNQVNEIIAGSKGRVTLDQGRGAPGYKNEHTKLMKSIRGEIPYVNEGMAVAESTLTCIMGRESAYSGMQLTWDQILNSKQDLMPKEWDYKAPGPKMDLPVPGQYKFV